MSKASERTSERKWLGEAHAISSRYVTLCSDALRDDGDSARTPADFDASPAIRNE